MKKRKEPKPAPSLFVALDEQRRQLRNAGCYEAAGIQHSRMYWRLPDGSVVMERDALAWLAGREGKGDAPDR